MQLREDEEMAGYVKATRLEYESRLKHPLMYETDVPVGWAKTAISLAERWGMVAAIPDGEDSSGRQCLRPMTPEEITERACDTAQRLYEEFEKRGVMLKVPAPEVEGEREDETV